MQRFLIENKDSDSEVWGRVCGADVTRGWSGVWGVGKVGMMVMVGAREGEGYHESVKVTQIIRKYIHIAVV